MRSMSRFQEGDWVIIESRPDDNPAGKKYVIYSADKAAAPVKSAIAVRKAVAARPTPVDEDEVQLDPDEEVPF